MTGLLAPLAVEGSSQLGQIADAIERTFWIALGSFGVIVAVVTVSILVARAVRRRREAARFVDDDPDAASS